MDHLNLWDGLSLFALLAVVAVFLMNAWRLRHVPVVLWLARFNQDRPLSPGAWLYAVILGLSISSSAYAHALAPAPHQAEHLSLWGPAGIVAVAVALLLLARRLPMMMVWAFTIREWTFFLAVFLVAVAVLLTLGIGGVALARPSILPGADPHPVHLGWPIALVFLAGVAALLWRSATLRMWGAMIIAALMGKAL